MKVAYLLPTVLGIVALTSASCASAPKKDNDPGYSLQDFESNTPPPDDHCKAKDGAPRVCATDADCCDGYGCTKDPEGSRHERYCFQM